MRIGITYDLRSEYLALGYNEQQVAEFDSVTTIDAIDEGLRLLGHTTDRIGNIRVLTQRLAAGDRWDLVFNIAEGLHGIGREAQVPALLDAYSIPYTFSDTVVLAVALDKSLTKRLVSTLGVRTPQFALVQDESDLAHVDLPWPVMAKPVAGGTGVGISKASKAANHTELKATCRNLLGNFKQPVLVETFLPGREYTVGVVGTGRAARVLGVMAVMFAENPEGDIYSYINKRDYWTCMSYCRAEEPIASLAAEMALRVWNGLGCRDAGRLDLRCDADGNLNFLEINPLAGLHPVDSDLVIIGQQAGIAHPQLIEMIVNSALERVPQYAGKGTA